MTKEEKSIRDKAWYQNNKERKTLTMKDYHEANKQEISANKKVYHAANKEKKRVRSLKYYYNITLEDYNKMFNEQNGCCAICNTNQNDLVKKLAVDHCHSSLKIRGLLCHYCNTGLGMFKDNTQFLIKAADYLDTTNNNNETI